MSTGMHTLMDVELDQVLGGADPNYHFCWNTWGGGGPGAYPSNVACLPSRSQLINDFLRAGGVKL